MVGANGYNHAVDILNDLCEALYSKTVNGKKVAKGRSINANDINSKTTYPYKEHESLYNNTTYVKYGAEFITSRYPGIYEKETTNIQQTDVISEHEGLEDGE